MRPSPILAVCLLAVPAAAQVRAPLDAPLVVADQYKQVVETLDLNGDGWTDAFGWWVDGAWDLDPGHGFLHGWINDGAGNLVLAWDVPYVNYDYDVMKVDVSATGDVDGDGDDDFVIATTNDVRVYLSNGAQPPTVAIVAAPIWSGTDCVTLADVDGDGALELVLAEQGIAIYDIDVPGQTLVLRTSITTNFVATGKLIVAELTGDGELDVLLSGSRVYPIVNGQLQPFAHNFGIAWPLFDGNSLRFDAGDVDGDGDLDLVSFVANPSSGLAQYRIVRRTGPGTWNVESPTNGGPARILVDVDADGDLDGVCCGGGGGHHKRASNTSPSAFRIALNDGTGAFAGAISIPSVGSQAIGGVADLDHDGDLDFVGGRCVLYGQGSITSHPMPTVGSGPQDARTMADADGDGDLDYEPRLASVRRNRGDGVSEFVARGLPPAIPGTFREGQPFAGDWDGDGDQDLLVRLGVSAGYELLRDVGCGVYESAGIVAGPTGAASFPNSAADALCVDVDGDGDRDLVQRTRTATFAEGVKSAWWSNDGAGALTWRETFAGYVVAEIADLDGNGIPDVVATGYFGGSNYPLSWRAGLGAGAFGPWIVLKADSRIRFDDDQLAVADVDADGDLDVVSPAFQQRRVWLFQNDGAGTFTDGALVPQELYTTNQTPLTVAAGDLNGDGLVDIAFGPVAQVPDGVALLFRRADNSTWEPPVLQTVFDELGSQTIASRFTLADPDGDGDADVVSNRLVRNTREQGDEGGRRLQVHDGVAGQAAITPVLGADGPFRVGERAQIRLRGLRPGSSGFLVASHASDPAPTGLGGMHVAQRYRIQQFVPVSASGVAGGPAGSGAWNLDFSVPGYAVGRTTCYTAWVEDADAPDGTARSNHLYVTYGP